MTFLQNLDFNFGCVFNGIRNMCIEQFGLVVKIKNKNFNQMLFNNF